jgi:putative membrane protein
MSAVFAFLHHVAAFALVGALASEFFLVERHPTAAQARKLQRADLVYGISAGVLLVVGPLRVFVFENGGSSYFTNVFFLAKLSLFAVVGLASIYPTAVFLSWSRYLKVNQLPHLTDSQVRGVRSAVVLELVGIVGIVLCASLMARGFGQFG